MESKNAESDLQFLTGGGEMGQLIREKDWAKTTLGDPSRWPQSLRTSLSIILNSKFPMFLFWGPDLICFYNDAYRPSLGIEGKHPNILGGRGEDFWQEIWKDIKPIIDKVIDKGEASWYEDMLLPIYRNGTMEDVYWTFSYSPVNDESGKPAGVFVVCSETTEKVWSQKKVVESNQFNKTVLESSPDCVKLIDIEGRIQYMNTNGLFLMEIDDFNVISNTFWSELWGKENSNLVNETIEKVRAGETATFQAFCPTNKGNPKWWDVSVSPVKEHETNKVIKFISVSRDITSDKIAEKSLRESEERLRLATETSGVGIWEWNVLTNEIRWDSQMFRIYGIRPSPDGTIDSSSWRSAVAPEDIALQEKLLQNLIKNKSNSSSNRSFKIIRKSDLKICHIEAIETVRTIDGEAQWVVGTNIDVTERILVEEELKKTSSHLELSTKSAEVGTWLLQIDSAKLEWSSLHKRMWGYDDKLQNLEYEHWHSLIHPEDKEKCFTEVDNSRKEKRKYEVDYRILRANDGLIRWMKSVGQYHFNEKGEAITLTGISLDITSERTQQQLLVENEQKFRLLADSMPQHIWTADTEGNLNYYNKSVFEYSGMSLEEINEKGWLSIVHPDDRDENVKQWIKSVTTGVDFLYEHRFRRHDGSYRWQLSRAIAQKDANGKIQMWVGTSTDVEDQKMFTRELERKVAERTEELEKMNKELQSFAYISSHDLQEPLRKIQLFSNQIIDSEFANLSETGKDRFQRMQNAAMRMQTLINDLLAYSRTNIQEKKFKLINLNTIIDEVKENLKEELEQKNAVIEVEEIGEVPVIPFQFEQLMYNLVSNSLKFALSDVTPHMEIKGEVAKGEELHNKRLEKDIYYCHITFSDNGIGFEEQYNERIFEVFQRLHGKEVYQGTGIGLAIVKKIIDNHNGVITAKGNPDNGATFEIYIPMNN